jgi:predicted XRE-type DNA-binding protein
MGSGNVFADLGFPEPEKWLFKAQLTAHLQRLIDGAEMPLAQAATQLGVAEEELERLLSGSLREVSIDFLFQCLNRLGHTIEVHVSPGEAAPGRAGMTLVTA